MSTFSSVIHKPGKKFAPKATPRRNVQRSGLQSAIAKPRASPARETTVDRDEELPPSLPGNLLLESSTTPNSTVVTAFSPTSTLNTRSMSFEANITNAVANKNNPLPAIKTQTAAHVQRISPNRLAATSESTYAAELSASDNGPSCVPPVKSFVHSNPPPANTPLFPVEKVIELRERQPLASPQGVKRKQAASDLGDGGSAVASAAPVPIATPKPASVRKRRKTTPQPSSSYIRAHGTVIPPSVATSQTSSRSASTEVPMTRRFTQPTDALLQNATSQAATVSALADAIDSNTRATRQSSRKRRVISARTGSVADTTDDTEAEQTRRSRRPRPRQSTIQDAAAEIVAEAAGEAGNVSRGRTRRKTPEGAEYHEIEPTAVKMGDLVKDEGLGRKSTREAAMQEIDWDKVKKQRRLEGIEAQKRKEAHEKEKTIASRDPNASVPAAIGLEMEVGPDGEIRVVDASREVDRQAEAVERAADREQVVIEEDVLKKRVNQLTVGRFKGLHPGLRWDEEMDDRFYKGLRMFGTDFQMIKALFPELTRRHIKLKYVREEKYNLARIHYNLHPARKEPVDLGELQEITDRVYEDPKKVQADIAAQEKRLRDEDDERRGREDGEPHPDEETVLQSREQGSAEPEDLGSDREDTEALDGDASTNENRFASEARAIVRDAVGPKKKRKSTGQIKKKDASKRGKRPMEGVEERLGPIDEVTR